jgi:2-polyprenyl-6-hydroxyphenyl methylase / 3-demethylubiquinone-9 3-methyltransferase
MESQNDLKQLYGEEYVEAFEHQNRFRLTRLLKYIHLEKTCSVADFGCGNGMLMEFIAPHVESYIGVDFSEAFIEAANAKRENLLIPNARFECTDIIAFCQRHQHVYDVAFAMDFSEHVYDDEWSQILRSMRSSLKPKGKLYLHTPNAEFFLERMKARGFLVKQFPEHVAVRTPEQNANLLQEAGFQVTRIRFIAHYNAFLRIVHPLSFVPVIGKFFKARILVEATS